MQSVDWAHFGGEDPETDPLAREFLIGFRIRQVNDLPGAEILIVTRTDIGMEVTVRTGSEVIVLPASLVTIAVSGESGVLALPDATQKLANYCLEVVPETAEELKAQLE